MALLKRLSDGFWSYIAPSQTPELARAQPFTSPKTVPPMSSVTAATDELLNGRSSRQKVEEGGWRIGVFNARSRELGGGKRKRDESFDEGPDEEREWKSRKVEGETPLAIKIENDDVHEVDESGAWETDGEEEDQAIHSRDVSSLSGDSGDDASAMDAENDTAMLSPDSYERSKDYYRHLATPNQAALGAGLSTEELQAQGWDEDHIYLVQRLAMRGFEPILPNFWHFGFRHWMPDNLFADTDDAIISSSRDRNNEARVALERLFGFGGWVRDALHPDSQTTPEREVRKHLSEYMRWADRDADLNSRTTLPLLIIQTGDADTPASVLKARAERRLAHLAARYRDALRVKHSIELSPASSSTILSQDLPTLYAIVASHTLVALVAYRTTDDNPEIKSVAFFDMSDKDYDVWNAFALAIAVCHLRNVQLRIARDTGLGLKVPGEDMDDIEDDPDL